MNTKITSFETACQVLGIDPTFLPEVSNLREDLAKRCIANYKMDIIVDALNNEGLPEKWLPDYSKYSQGKFEPWFDFSPGSGWSLIGVAYRGTTTFAGARRNFRTKKIAEYAGTRFIDLYNEIL